MFKQFCLANFFENFQLLLFCCFSGLLFTYNTTRYFKDISIKSSKFNRGKLSFEFYVNFKWIDRSNDKVTSKQACLFSFIGNRKFHEFESEQVVHVHALGPAFLVTNLGLVLQVANDLGLARQSPKIKIK